MCQSSRERAWLCAEGEEQCQCHWWPFHDWPLKIIQKSSFFFFFGCCLSLPFLCHPTVLSSSFSFHYRHPLLKQCELSGMTSQAHLWGNARFTFIPFRHLNLTLQPLLWNTMFVPYKQTNEHFLLLCGEGRFCQTLLLVVCVFQ